LEKRQAELIVSALVTLTTANMDIVYKDMVTKSHQEIAVQQIMSHLDSIRKDMVILEKSEFANLRSENTVASLKTVLESLKLETIRYLAGPSRKILADSEKRVGPGVKIGGEKSGTTMQNSQFLISMEISTPPLPHLLLPPPFSCSGEHQVKILLEFFWTRPQTTVAVGHQCSTS
ncbi:hypothetical protein XENOCAPTIV_005921, partial [Xenoophorus captivus]